jgi:hypothetical protein
MATEVLLLIFAGGLMFERSADIAVLGLVSILYSIVVFFLKQRRA